MINNLKTRKNNRKLKIKCCSYNFCKNTATIVGFNKLHNLTKYYCDFHFNLLMKNNSKSMKNFNFKEMKGGKKSEK